MARERGGAPWAAYRRVSVPDRSGEWARLVEARARLLERVAAARAAAGMEQERVRRGGSPAPGGRG